MKDFSNEEYGKAQDRFKYLIKESSNEDLIAESIYFTALSFENQKNHDKAEEYYSLYIDKYREKNYYDDSLYNYGLMMHEKGDISASKQILRKLKRELPESDFVNSKVESILEE